MDNRHLAELAAGASPLRLGRRGADRAVWLLCLARDLTTTRLSLQLCIAVLALGGARLSLAEPHFNDTLARDYNDRSEVDTRGHHCRRARCARSCVFYELDAKSLTLQDTEARHLTGPRCSSHPRADGYPVYDYGDQVTVHGALRDAAGSG